MRLKANNTIFKFRNPKWNISILVIFVLLASSLIWILTMNFVKQMVSYTNDMYSYNKSYYYAKAGLELALVEIDNAGIGFSNKIEVGDDIFVDNFDCNNCGFELEINWKTQHLSDKFWMWSGCDDDNAFVLGDGESMILPLFTQAPIENNLAVFDEDIKYNKDVLKHIDDLQLINNQPYEGKFNLGLIVLLDGEIQRDLLFMKSFDGSKDMFQNYFEDYENYYGRNILEDDKYLMYLVFSNVEEELVSFCVHMDDINIPGNKIKIKLATTKFFVKSLWTYINKTIGLNAIYGQPIPSFLNSIY